MSSAAECYQILVDNKRQEWNLLPPERGQSDQDLGRAAFGIGSPFPMNSQNTVACGSSSRESRPVEDDVRGNTGSLESPVEV